MSILLNTKSGLAALLIAGLAMPVLGDGVAVPAKKQTQAGLYLTSSEAADVLRDGSVLLLDVRSRPEVTFLGMPVRVDVHIPFMVMPQHPHYDPKKQNYVLERNSAFEFDFEDFAEAGDLSEDTRIVLICRSGSRSAKAADALHGLGYTNVYTVIDGFEGDKAKAGPNKGQRVVNGWKNTGLEWSYSITPEQAYPADRL